MRTQFAFHPFPRGKAPAHFASAPVIRFAMERRNNFLLRPDQAVELYQQWKNGSLQLNPTKATRFLLEVKIQDDNEGSYFYHYPIDLNYLFSPRWRADNLSSPSGLFRWAVEMDTALRFNMVQGYENLRLGNSFLQTCHNKIKKAEGKAVKYKHINLSLAGVLHFNTLLHHLETYNSLDFFYGNSKQAALAKAAGISHLRHLFSALSNLTNSQGIRWAEVLGHNSIELPSAKVASFLNELFELIDAYALSFDRFRRDFVKLSANQCYQRFIKIKQRTSQLHSFINQNKREDWPQSFYDYLFKTLCFLASDEPVNETAQRIIDYIENNEDKIEDILSELAGQPLSYEQLRQHFGEFTIPVVRFYGGLQAIKSRKRGSLRERLALNIPIPNLADTQTPTPLEALLIKEAQEQLAALQKAILTLPAEDQAIIQRIFFENEDPEAVAKPERLRTILEQLEKLIG